MGFANPIFACPAEPTIPISQIGFRYKMVPMCLWKSLYKISIHAKKSFRRLVQEFIAKQSRLLFGYFEVKQSYKIQISWFSFPCQETAV